MKAPAEKADGSTQPGSGKTTDAEVVDIPDNAETNAAAAKLQAVKRGNDSRKEVAAKKEEGSKDAAGEEEVDIPDNDETNAAAAKLQAVKRGNDARKSVEAKKAEGSGEEAEKPAEAAEEAVDIPDNDETNAAAAKLQAVKRGNDARKEVEEKKAAEGEEKPEEEKPAEETVE